MKKFLVVLLSVTIIALLAACGSKEPETAPIAETAIDTGKQVEVTKAEKTDEAVIEVPAAEVPAAAAEPVVEEPVVEEPVVEEPVVEEPVVEEEPVVLDPFTVILNSAVKTVEAGKKYYLANENAEYLWLGENGWHITMSADNKSALRFDDAGNGYFALTSEEFGMRVNVYGGEIDVMNAAVAMYPNSGAIEKNEMFKPEAATDDGLGFKLKGKGSFYLSASSRSADANLTIVNWAPVFYLIEEVSAVEEQPEVEVDAALAGLTAPEKAVKKVTDGAKYFLSNGKGEFLWLGDNGWHISMSATQKSALRFDKIKSGFYSLTSEDWNMRVNIWDGKVGVMNAAVAMYPVGGDATSNETLKPVHVGNDEHAYRLKSTGDLYLHVSSADKDAYLTDEANATIFYLVKDSKK